MMEDLYTREAARQVAESIVNTRVGFTDGSISIVYVKSVDVEEVEGEHRMTLHLTNGITSTYVLRVKESR